MKTLKTTLGTLLIGFFVFVILAKIWVLLMFGVRFYLDRQIADKRDRCQILGTKQETCIKNYFPYQLLQVIVLPGVTLGIPAIMSASIGYWITRKMVAKK